MGIFMLKKLFSSFSINKAVATIAGLSLVVFAGTRAGSIKSFLVDRNFITVEANHQDGKYNLNDQAVFRVITQKTPSDANFRLYFQAYINDAAVDLDNAQNQLSVVKTLTDYIPYTFKVDVYLEDAKRIDAFTSSLEKVNDQINYIEDLIANGSTDESLPAELARLNTLKISLTSQIQKYRKFIEEKTVTVTVSDPRPRVSFAQASESMDAAQNPAGSFTVNMDKAFTSDVAVPFTVGGTAIGPAGAAPDHNLANGTVTIPAGSTTGIINFSIVGGYSPNWPKTIVVTLGTPSTAGVVLGNTITNTMTVNYTAQPPQISSGTYYIDSDHAPSAVILTIVPPAVAQGRTVQSLNFDFGDGSKASVPYAYYQINQSVKHIYGPGSSTVKVSATDDQGLTGPAISIPVTVQEGVRPTPKITATVDANDPQTVHFDASGSSIQSGATALEYRWTIASNNGFDVRTQTASSTFPVVPKGSNPVTYQVRLRVTDNLRFRAQTYMQVIVTDAGAQIGTTPSANYSLNSAAVGAAPYTVTFDGSGSFDASGGAINNVYWSFDDSLSYDNVRPGLTATHTFTRSGTYVASMTVINSSGNTTTQWFPIYVMPGTFKIQPLANIIYLNDTSAANSIYFDTDQVNLSGIVDPTMMSWDFGDGAKTNWRYANHRYDLGGSSSVTETVRVSMLDMWGNYYSQPQSIVVRQGGQFPVINTGSSITFPFTGTVNSVPGLVFDASAVSDPLGLGLSFEWKFGDSPLPLTVTTPTISHPYSVMGIYQPFVLIYNNERRGSRFSGLTTINDANGNNPIAPHFTATPNNTGSLTVNFDASSTTVNSGTVVEYYWSFGDNANWPQVFSVSSAPQASYTFSQAGIYWVNLFVKDSNGNVNMINQQITVGPTTKAAATSPAPVQPPPGYNGREGCYQVNGHTECYSRPDGDN